MHSTHTLLQALATADSGSLAAHPNLKYTENGQRQMLGLGLWQSKPDVAFARHVIDTSACSAIVLAVAKDADGDIVFAVRLRYLADLLLDAEAFVVRANSAYYEPEKIVPTGRDLWVDPPAVDQRSSASELTKIAMSYFDSALDSRLLPPSAPGCERRMNGALMANRGSCQLPPGTQRFEELRYPVADELTGIASAIVQYAGFIGVYLLKIQAGVIQDIEVVGGARASTGW